MMLTGQGHCARVFIIANQKWKFLKNVVSEMEHSGRPKKLKSVPWIHTQRFGPLAEHHEISHVKQEHHDVQIKQKIRRRELVLRHIDEKGAEHLENANVKGLPHETATAHKHHNKHDGDDEVIHPRRVVPVKIIKFMVGKINETKGHSQCDDKNRDVQFLGQVFGIVRKSVMDKLVDQDDVEKEPCLVDKPHRVGIRIQKSKHEFPRKIATERHERHAIAFIQKTTAHDQKIGHAPEQERTRHPEVRNPGVGVHRVSS